MNDNSRPRVENVEPTRLIRTSAEFVADFKPPDYLIDGLLQRRFLYSLTAPTNIGRRLRCALPSIQRWAEI